MIDQLASNPVLVYLAGVASGAVLHFVFRDYPAHIIDRKAKRRDRAKEWCRDSRSALGIIISKGNQMVAQGKPDADLVSELEPTANDLISLAQNPPEEFDEEDEDLLNEMTAIGNTVLVLDDVLRMDKSNFSEIMAELAAIQERIQTEDITIEEGLNRAGGVPTGRKGESIPTEDAMEMIQLFVDELVPGLDPEEVETLSDLRKIQWELLDGELGEDKKMEMIEDAMLRSAQASLIRFPSHGIRQLNSVEDRF